MSEKKQRKTLLSEFKAKVDFDALNVVKTINEIGQAHGVQAGQWKKAIQKLAASLLEGKRAPKPGKRLSKIGKLKMELD